MAEISTGADFDRLNHLMHCADNCSQMLQAIDRKLGQALRCLDVGEVGDGRSLLDAVSAALPQAIAIIEHDDGNGREQFD